MSIFHSKEAPESYLESYIRNLQDNASSWFVEFEDDPHLKYSSRQVVLPLSKLVFGFANGWAFTSDDKVVYFEPKHIQLAYNKLEKANALPRGFMFWVIGEEGSNGIHYAHDLGGILRPRTLGSNSKLTSADGDL
eukprot:scaffold25659_cov132-Cylindrotheca_fusiformis.AAC.1